MEQLKDIKTWLQHEAEFSGNEKAKPNPKDQGYRVLFNGPPRNAKIETAEMLGKEFNKKIYRVDLSQVVSKYIGETEKALAVVFKKAEGKDWILFFDEADALFGKRTEVGDSHDRFANLEVSYLLQRMETYPGLVILSIHLKGNVDDSFLRRFQTVLKFSKA